MTTPPHQTARPPVPPSAGQQLLELGREINANQYRVVHLAARYDDELEWFHSGMKGPAQWISTQLGIHSSTAREWIRVGHALRDLPVIDGAFAAGEVSFAKVRILTRWADVDNETALLALARERSADRLTTAIANHLAQHDDEADDERDRRHHDARGLTTWTDGDGMTVIRITLPPHLAKRILAAIDALVRMIAATPWHARPRTDDPPKADARAERSAPDTTDRHTTDPDTTNPDTTERGEHPPAGGLDGQRVSKSAAKRGEDPSAGGSGGHSVVLEPADPDGIEGLPHALAQLERRWQPPEPDQPVMPSLAQQRVDALVVLFLQGDVDITTEVVVHVRGDGITFDDGTPTTESAVVRQLDDALVRLLIHDAERRPVNASARRRHPTPAQKRVVLETHNHECVDCQSTDLLELDHNPPYHQSRRTVTDELEPRCGPCHRARHRFDHRVGRQPTGHVAAA